MNNSLKPSELTGKERAMVDELRERSKYDNRIVVGSEIRQLCGIIDRLDAAMQPPAMQGKGDE